jgi:hypothetical protein
VIELAAGCAAASVALCALLSLGLGKAWAVWAVAALAAAGVARKIEFRWSRPHPAWLLAAPGMCLTLIHALTPEIQPDATTYHLGLVAEWARTGAFGPRIGFYEILPLGMETLFLPAYLAAGPVGAKLVHWGLFLASLPLIARVGRQCGMQPGKAVLGAVFYSWTPVVMLVGSCAYTDAGLVFFTLAAFSALMEQRAWEAGLAAGFCYAVKMTGGIAALGLAGWLAARREWRRTLILTAAAAAVAGPWVVRAFCQTGNPLAPLANGLFVNDWFHVQSERVLASFLADYGGVQGMAMWKSLLWGGAALQGLAGPASVLLPLGLAAWRRRESRPLAAAALVLTIPWTLNHGARFLMPALPFAALSLASVLPAGAMAAVVVLHAGLAWPAVMDKYTDADAWRLRGVPWEAAIGKESAESYLTKNLWEYRFAMRVSELANNGGTLLDLYGLPYAYLPMVPLGPLSSAEFDNIVFTLNAAASGVPDRLYRVECEWPMEFVREARIAAAADWPIPLAISEARPMRRGALTGISRNWFVDARPNGGDSPLAIDNNAASRWSTLDAARGGEWWSLRFDRPVPIDGMRFELVNIDEPTRMVVTITGMAGRPRVVCEGAEAKPLPLDFRRRSAMGFAKSRGVQWIAGRTEGAGHAHIVRAMVTAPEAFGVKVAARVDDLVLFRVE